MKVVADALLGSNRWKRGTISSSRSWQMSARSHAGRFRSRAMRLACTPTAVRIKGRWCSIDIGFAPSVSFIEDPKGAASRPAKPVANLS
jgi:hypothetical protein